MFVCLCVLGPHCLNLCLCLCLCVFVSVYLCARVSAYVRLYLCLSACRRRLARSRSIPFFLPSHLTSAYNRFGVSETTAASVAGAAIVYACVEAAVVFLLSAMYAEKFRTRLKWKVLVALACVSLLGVVVGFNVGLVVSGAPWVDYVTANMLVVAILLVLSTEKDLLFQRRPGKVVIFGSQWLPLPVLLLNLQSHTIQDLSPSLIRICLGLAAAMYWATAGTLATSTSSHWLYPAAAGLLMLLLATLLLSWRSASSHRFARALWKLPPRMLQDLLHDTCPRLLQTLHQQRGSKLYFSARVKRQNTPRAPVSGAAALHLDEAQRQRQRQRQLQHARSIARRRQEEQSLDVWETYNHIDRRAQLDENIAHGWAAQTQGNASAHSLEDVTEQQLVRVVPRWRWRGRRVCVSPLRCVLWSYSTPCGWPVLLPPPSSSTKSTCWSPKITLCKR